MSPISGSRFFETSKRTLTPAQDAALAELMERLDAFPTGPMGNEEKSHFWLGWHHQRRDMRAE